MRSTIAALAISLAMTSIGHAQPALTETPHEEIFDALIAGRDASSSQMIEVLAHDSIIGVPTLEYTVEASDIVVAQKSQIRIELDGEPLAAHSLLSQTKSISVPLTPGFHKVSFHSTLRTGESCGTTEKENLWVKVQGKLRWSSVRSKPVSIADAFSAMNGKRVSIEVRAKAEPNTVLAALEMMHLAQKLGASEVLLQRDEQADVKVELSISPIVLTHAIGTIERKEEHTLVIRAADAASLRNSAVAASMQHKQCKSQKCLLNGEDLTRVTEVRSGGSSPEIFLSNLGYPFGWDVTGEDKHELKFVWVRPKDWEISGWPMLDLYYRAGGIGASTVTVEVGGKPLASWNVSSSGDTAKRLNIRIPKSYWNEEALSFTVTADLKSNRQTCDEEDPSFFSIEKTSTLQVPRIETLRRDIASLRVNTLKYSEMPWENWETVGRFLVGQRTMGPLSFGEVIADLRFDLKSPIRIVEEGGERVWKDDGGHQLPLIPLEQTLLVWAHEEGLVMQFGEGTREVEVPTMQERKTGLAFHFEGTWHALREAQNLGQEVVEEVEEADNTAAVESNEEILLRRIDTAWITLLGLMLAGGLIAIARPSRRRTA